MSVSACGSVFLIMFPVLAVLLLYALWLVLCAAVYVFAVVDIGFFGKYASQGVCK